MKVCEHVCGGGGEQRSVLDVFFLCFSPLIFLRQDLSRNPKLPHSARLDSGLQGSACVSAPSPTLSSGIADAHCSSWEAGGLEPDPHAMQRARYWLNHFSRPPNTIFKFNLAQKELNAFVFNFSFSYKLYATIFKSRALVFFMDFEGVCIKVKEYLTVLKFAFHVVLKLSYNIVCGICGCFKY